MMYVSTTYFAKGKLQVNAGEVEYKIKDKSKKIKG